MAQNSKIEWTHHTANLWHGCTKVHAGCDHCYAETLSRRWGRDIWGTDKPRMVIKSVWNDLKKFQQLAKSKGEYHRVFVGSMMDIFEKPMPVINNEGREFRIVDTGDLRDRLFNEISGGEYPNLLFLLLTKRPSNINKYIPESWKSNPPTNVMFGTSPVDQKTSDTLIPQLLQVKGYKFLSCEPLLGPIDLSKFQTRQEGEGGFVTFTPFHWVITGGESGHHARPMHPDWVRSIRNQCRVAEVPFLFKQWGEWSPGRSNDYYPEEKPLVCIKPTGELSWIAGDTDTTINHSENYEQSDCPIEKIGKKNAGRLLDRVEYTQFPEIHNIEKASSL